MIEMAGAVLVALLARDALLTGGRWAIRAFERYMVRRAWRIGGSTRGLRLTHAVRERFAP